MPNSEGTQFGVCPHNSLKSGIDSLTALVTDAEDGLKKAISAKNKQGELMIKQCTLLGHYVEAASNDDLATFNTRGSRSRRLLPVGSMGILTERSLRAGALASRSCRRRQAFQEDSPSRT